MEAVGESRDYDADVYRGVRCSGHDAIARHFIPTIQEAGISLGSCAVLAPQWFELRGIARNLSRSGIPVLGPGARPYRRATEFTGIAEAAAECVVEPSLQAAMRLERALLFCIIAVNRGKTESGSNWDRRKAMSVIKRHARHLHSSGCSAIDWITGMAGFSGEALEGLDLIASTGRQQIENTADLMVAQIQETQTREGGNAFGLGDLALFSNPKEAVQLSTIHSAKGREWDAVAIVDLHDNKIPHQRSSNVEEARRLFYVGCTRPKKMLMLYHYDTETPTRFLRLLN